MTSTLRGLPQFLRYVSTYPGPDTLAPALWRGPLATCGARTGVIWILHDDDALVRLCSFGESREESDRYGLIPLSLDFDIVTAVREGRTIISPAASYGQTRALGVDDEFWLRLVNRVEGVSLVSAPIMASGAVVGALGFLTSTPWPDDAESAALVDAITSILGLWMTHPLSGIDLDAEPSSDARQASLALSERQATILGMVGTGWTTMRIAVALGLSESTVKSDVQHVMRVLRTSDRKVALQRATDLGLL